jgi:hypothetical protein
MKQDKFILDFEFLEAVHFKRIISELTSIKVLQMGGGGPGLPDFS